VIVGGALPEERARPSRNCGRAVRKVALACVEHIAHVALRARRLIAQERTPPAALLRIEEIHCRAAERGTDEQEWGHVIPPSWVEPQGGCKTRSQRR
jgi:hypothetical protein